VELARRQAPTYRHTIIALDGNFEMASGLSDQIDFKLAVEKHDKGRHLANIPRFRRRIREYAPDVLVTYNWGAIEWALADRWAPLVPHIHIEDGFGPDEREHQLARRIWFRRIALSGAHTKIVVPSHRLFEIARDQWRLPSTVLIPNGVDCERFVPREANPERDQLVIGTVAALRPEKNIARLIQAFAQIPTGASTPQLLIFGDGPERARLEALAHDLGIADRVEFRGATSVPEAALSEIDVFAISSDTEQMPLSVLEAMAMGLPIASVAVGDIAVMVAPENAPFVVPLSDDQAFVDALRRLVEDASLRKQLGQANRKAAAERYDINLMSARYAELYG
jgi:glycosyltransferase involved in cell wall biosynthesis